jgi:protein-S-isoprenylcysteine O-methyltransferase Ste14
MRKTPSPRSRQVIMAIVLLLLGWLCITYGRQDQLVLHSSPALEAAGALLLLAGLVVRILAFQELRCTHRIDRLVTSGIYARTRNPVYLAFALIILGAAFLSRTWLAFLWAGLSVMVFWWVARKEESDLERAFGEEYVSYRKRVPMLLPRLWR